MQDFYRFLIAGIPTGYYYLRQDPASVLSFTRFRLPDGTIFVNRFDLAVECDGDHGLVRVTRARHNAGPIVDYHALPEDAFPGSAYPLLLPRVACRLPYVMASEDAATVVGSAVLERRGPSIVETVDGVESRTFTMDGGEVVRIHWGRDAYSERCADANEAVAGSGLDWSIPRDRPFG